MGTLSQAIFELSRFPTGIHEIMTEQLSDGVQSPNPPLSSARDVVRKTDLRKLFNLCTRLSHMFESQDAEWSFGLQEMKTLGGIAFPALLKNNTIVIESVRI